MTLEALGLDSYATLYRTDPVDVIERLGDVPVHAGDAFLAVLVLRAVADLRRAADRLDAARRRWDLVALVVAVIAAVAAVVAVVK